MTSTQSPPRKRDLGAFIADDLMKNRPSNGPEKTPEEIAVESAVKHHVASYQKLVSENTALKERLDKMEQLLTINKIELEGLRAEKAAAETRVMTYQHDRDDAVANLAVYQSLFVTVQGILRTFGVEHAALVREPPRVP